jgi:lipid II:glycine glycyltransferase (peptidoglycan interpeptide bridge formation enzyme)
VGLEAAGRFDATALVLRRDIPRTGRTFFYLPRGPILDWSRPGVAESMMTRLKELAGPHKAVFIKIDPAVPDETPGFKEQLAKMGFVPSPDAAGHFGGTQPRCNMKLSLEGSLDDIQARFHQKWRYNIRLAAKKGVEVHSDTSRSDLKIFHDIYRVTAGRNKFTGRPLSYFEKMWDALEPAGLMKLFVVYHDSVPLSAAICFLLPPQCWYVYGASSNQHRNLMPNHLMQWTMIQWAKENGCNLYDFRGVPDPTQSDIPPHEEGLVKFKSGFGAEMVRYAGEFDLPLNKNWYWMWTTARPKLVEALKKMKR